MTRFGRGLVCAIAVAASGIGVGAMAFATPVSADGGGGPSSSIVSEPGPPGYAMAGHMVTVKHPNPTASDVIGGSYTHAPAPNAQPDLPPGSGPTMHTLTIYAVFWLPSGHFGASAADDSTYENLLQRWAGDINGTPYYNLVTQYYDASNSNTHITSSASFGGGFVDTATAYPHTGTTTDPLTDGDIQTEVHHAVSAQGWTEDINHVVAVFTANGIQECDASGMSDGHCTFPVGAKTKGAFCAYHNNWTDGSNDSLYAFMSYDDMFHGGNCDAGGPYPNGSTGADSEVSTLSHEIIETVTDPHPNNAWTAPNPYGEIGDECNFNFAPRNDIGADVYLNAHPYVIQQEFSNAVHTCAIDLCGSSVCAPSVTFTKTVDNTTPEVTRSATYTVTLNNTNDTGAATNLAFTDTLPAGYTVTNVSAPSATAQSNTASSVTVNYDTLPVHQSRTVSISVTVPTQAGVLATNCGSVALQNLLGTALSSQTTNPCASTTPRLIQPTLTYTGATTQDFDDPAIVSAKLLDDLSNPVAGHAVTFTLNGNETCNATTNGSGDASCSITPGEAAGPYALVAAFAGTTVYGATSVTTTFTVTHEETTVNYTGPTILANAKPATLSGVLLEDGTTPIAGRSLTLSLGSGASLQSCTATTDATGTATCMIASVTQPLGPGSAGVAFAGDAYYLPSSATASTLLFAYTSGGSFVVGDKTVGPIGSAVGKAVTFWGAIWAKNNALSGGTPPSAFKGFEDNPALPQNGVSWKDDPFTPAPTTVPLYTAMIVSGTITKSGAIIVGNDLHVVIVLTNPGYAPNDHKTGTGTIVAVFS